jgi:hypothetical protein
MSEANKTAEHPQTFSPDYVNELREEAKFWRRKVKGQKEQNGQKEQKQQKEQKGQNDTGGTRSVDDGGISPAARGRILAAELKVAAMKAGLSDLDMLKLVDSSGISVTSDGVEGADAALAALKASKPQLFGGGNTSSAAAAPKAGEKAAFNALSSPEDEVKARLAEIKSRRR